MATFTAPAAQPNPPPAKLGTAHRPLDPVAGVLSYLVPGLGQIVQGRVGKGLLFLVCIYSLFFYGLYLGMGSVTIGPRTYRLSSNVYLPDTFDEADAGKELPRVLRFLPRQAAWNLYNRPQFAGQFWVGIAAWPAVWQYMHYDRAEVHELERQIDRLYNEIGQDEKNKEFDRAEEKRKELEDLKQNPRLSHPYFGDFMREPSMSAVNAVHNAGDKRLELAWVYTVIAGVLNIMVIYDAIAGPAFPDASKDPQKKPS
jgi:hypothetical protein